MKLTRNPLAIVIAACLAAMIATPGVSFAIGESTVLETEGEQVGSEDAVAQNVGSEEAVAQNVGTEDAASQGVGTQDVGSQGIVSAEATPVFDAEGLLAMANNPYGTYQLMCDVDLAGIAWQPIEFHGTLEGNGHAILNASVTSTGQARRSSYDGNMKEYTTAFAGFFDTLESATVCNVTLLGLNVDVNTSEPTFVGGLVGYMDDATIEGCTVVGQVSLATTGASFGVGGIAGFGRGRISGSVADVTLICRDLDAYEKDEQFMGGIYAVGYADLLDNRVILRGYDSDHGYVHNGGFVGMYIVYDETAGHTGTVSNNSVRGFITFFEDNEDRRAYCEPEIGENMSMEAITTREGNTSDFTPDERFEYDVDLLPHTCENPQWNEEVVSGSCNEHGYTQRTCATCGYSERVAWTPVVHEVTEWSDAGEPAADGLVVKQGTCTRCGATVYEREPMAQATQEEDGSEASASATAEEQAQGNVSAPAMAMWPFALGIAVVAIAVVLGLLLLIRR